MLEVHVCNHDGLELRAFALGDSDELIIGRDAHCDIRIEAKSVSREHCAIERQGAELLLRDLGSTGGTWADGCRLEKVQIRPGLVVTVGPALLKFVEAGP